MRIFRVCWECASDHLRQAVTLVVGPALAQRETVVVFFKPLNNKLDSDLGSQIHKTGKFKSGV